MRKLLAGVFLLALACGLSRSASAAIYPPGPSPFTCTDTLTNVDIQNPSATCHPASGDTVYGARGIVIGFDKDVSPFNVYTELASGAPFSGMAVFTGATNYFGQVPWPGTGGGLDLGDEIVYYGRALEFNNLTEFTDFDNIQTTNDIIIRRTTTGNAQPPTHVDTVHNLNWVPGLSAATAEPWESCVVKIRGPLTVGRTAGNGIGSRSFLMTCPSCGADSAAVDGFSLTNVPAPTVGTAIDSVQGILTQTTINSISSYRILLRSSDDLFAALPPSVTDAYPLEDNIIRVLFDRPVTNASATNTSNYSLASFGAVNSATLEAGGKAVDLNITNGLVHGDQEQVTVSGVTSSSGITMPGSQSRTFINGVLSLAEIQAPDPAVLAAIPCGDRSRFTTATGGSGTRLTYRGIQVFGVTGLNYLSDPVAGQRSGMTVFGSPQPLVAGHKYELAGQVQEFDGINTTINAGETEGVTTVFLKDEGTATIPAPQLETIKVLTDTTCDANQNKLTGEDFEGVYIKVQSGQITENRTAGQSFLMTVGTNPSGNRDTILVNNNNPSFVPDSLDIVDVVGGLAWRNTGTKLAFRIDDQTITHKGTLGVGGGPAAQISLSVSNPSRQARVSFSVPKTDAVELSVYDLTGRRIATLMRGTVPAGQYTRVWDGRDQNGTAMRAGMYFYRLKSGGQLLTTHAVKLD